MIMIMIKVLQLPSLTHRRHRGGMMLLYKILNNYFNSDFSNNIYIPTPIPPSPGDTSSNC